jgi:RNA polymerase sigma-70 factor (sigma-E family)
VRRRAETDAEFTEFLAARSTQLYRSAYLLTTSPHAAEDLLQTALAKTYAAWGRVQRADDPVAYVHGVLIKTFLSERRKRSSSELPTAEPSLLDRADRSPRASEASDPTDRVALTTALARLAPLDRAVVVLRFWEDRSVAQTATDLDLSEAAVKNRSLRALRTLRELLAPSDYQPTHNGSTS